MLEECGPREGVIGERGDFGWNLWGESLRVDAVESSDEDGVHINHVVGQPVSERCTCGGFRAWGEGDVGEGHTGEDVGEVKEQNSRLSTRG